MSRNSRVKRECKKYNDAEYKPSEIIQFEGHQRRIEPLNESQRQFISALRHDEIVIGAGKAGTGKTYLASVVAAELFQSSNNFKHLILTRPNIEVGKGMGYLPGELDEKYAPFLEPFEKGLKHILGNKFQADLGRTILPQPLSYMRGKTFDNAIMLLDEAQNTTIPEMEVFLTRVGIGSRIFITGDDTNSQNDLKGVKENGLQWLIRQIDRQALNIETIKFNKEDCVRSELCKKLLFMIENQE